MVEAEGKIDADLAEDQAKVIDFKNMKKKKKKKKAPTDAVQVKEDKKTVDVVADDNSKSNSNSAMLISNEHFLTCYRSLWYQQCGWTH